MTHRRSERHVAASRRRQQETALEQRAQGAHLAVGLDRRRRDRDPLDDPDRRAASSRRSGPRTTSTSSGWWTIFTNPGFTLDNYDEVLNGPTALSTYFVNSIVITIPAVLIPISIATMAAYAFAWMKFQGRNVLFVAVFALQIVPIQVTMIPLLSLYVDAGPDAAPRRPAAASTRSGSRTRSSRCRWRSSCCTTSCRQIPGELIESARVDGAGHVQIFSRIMLPLMAPGDRGVRHLPVPLGLERPAGRAGLRRRQPRRLAADGTAGRARPAPAGRTGSCCRPARSSR